MPGDADLSRIGELFADRARSRILLSLFSGRELAAGVLAPIGFVLPMSVGAILMSASTVVVALNAQLLRRLDLTPEQSAARALNRTASN